ncbi:hypothetical protein THARTR1_00757 [Trichoderma harzianum]|uniref:Uncharacterized protein n=1 Tax=Trichoderma harzianum TaxID=5544 RepID=A0A2K0UP77_TRIHA|nr:hypothetical protein THARTR1_00757 [Trichoderma harzianum]
MDMRKDYAHCSSILYTLYKSITALVGHSHEWSNASVESSDAEPARIINGDGRVLQVDEETVKASISRKLDNLRIGYQPNAECLGSSQYPNAWIVRV